MIRRTAILLCLMLVGCAVKPATIPGTRMIVDWPRLVSGQDIINHTPPADPLHGLLLGNGDIGVSVFGQPDCVTLQVGKNDIWDYRDPADSTDELLTQADLVKAFTTGTDVDRKRIDELSNKFSAFYATPMHVSKPAGQIRFRNTGLKGAPYKAELKLWDAQVDLSMGKASLQTFVPYQTNVISTQYLSPDSGQFDIELARHKDATGTIPNGPEFGANGNEIWLRYHFPADATYPKGFEYVMVGRVIGGQVTSEVVPNCGTIKQTVWLKGLVDTTEGEAVAHIKSSSPVTLLVAVATSRDDANPFAKAKHDLDTAERAGTEKIAQEHRDFWHTFWQRSFVQLPNAFLTKHWFVSNYHLACCSRPGKIAPGLYGNWTWEDASAWWDDYHWDYNFEQTFWGAYSCNHLEQAEPYNSTVKELLSPAMDEAKRTYGLTGAKYFLTTYPRKTTVSPFRALPYDRVMSLSAWAAQEMWYYFLYSQNTAYLRTDAYPVMKQCAQFYEGFLTKSADGKYDIIPTYSPEHWSITRNFDKNKNCLLDLTLIKYLMNACIQASETLNIDADRRPTWRNIADNLRPYPTHTNSHGTVFVDVEGAPPIPYNVPVPTMAMFPGDDIGLHSDAATRDIATRTVNHITYNLANQYVMLPMSKVRLGMDVFPEFEKATRELRMSNGALIDKDMPDIWVENFAAPLVMNESIIQSYNGIIRFAPVKLKEGATFANLRTVGAFLISGEINPGGDLAYAAITSEAGGTFTCYCPWSSNFRVRDASNLRAISTTQKYGTLSFGTKKGATYILDLASSPWEKQPVKMICTGEPQAEN